MRLPRWRRTRWAVALAALALLGGSRPLAALPSGQAAPLPGYRLLETWTERPWTLSPGHFAEARDIGAAPDGSIFILDARQAAIHRLAPDGSPQAVFRVPGTRPVEIGGEGWLPCQMDLGFDGRIHLLLKDVEEPRACWYGAARVARLDAEGRLLDWFDAPQADEYLYADLAVGADGRIYLSRYGDRWEPFSLFGPRAIDVLSPDGELIESLIPEALGIPAAIDVAADGRVFVVNRVPDEGSGAPPGPEPTPEPSWRGARRPDQAIASPIEGVLVLDPDHRYRETVPFVNARDVAVGPAGVFVSREAEIFPLGERRPVYQGPGGYAAVLRLAAPADGRLLAAMNHCYFQGLVTIGMPAGRPAPALLSGSLDRPALEGPVFPLRLDAGAGVALLQGGFDVWGAPPDRLATSSLFAEEPQTVQRWTAAGPAPGDGRLASQLGLCGRWDSQPTHDLALDGADVYTIDDEAVRLRPDDRLPAWTFVPSAALADPEGGVLPSAISAGGGRAALLDSARNRVLVLDRSGRLLADWAIGGGPGALPVDLALDPEAGRLYLADAGGSRVLVRDLAGRDLGAWPTADGPRRIAAGPDGDVFVLGRGGWALRYDPAGLLLAAWPLPDRSLDAPDIGVDDAGRVYVPFVRRDNQAGPLSWFSFGGFGIEQAGVWVFEPSATAPPQVPPDPSGGCVARPDKRAAPARIPLGAEVEVTLELQGACPPERERLQLVLVFDRSRSMNMDGALVRARAAGALLLGELDSRRTEAALVTYDEGAALALPLSRDLGALRARIAGLRAWGDTRLAPGIESAVAELSGPRGDPSARRVILMVGDGVVKDDPAAAAERARAAGIELYALLFWNMDFDNAGDEPILAFEALTGSPERVLFEPPPGFLARLARDMAGERAEPGLFETVRVQDRIPANMRYLPGSAEPPAQYDAGTHSLTWTLGAVAAAEGLRLRYRLQPQAVGTWPTNVEAQADYRDARGQAGRLVFPIPQVEVIAPQHRAYLPFAARASCLRPLAPLDIVLVMDRSTSMAEPDAGGARSKLEAARLAAEAFVDQLDPQADRVGVVRFNREAGAAAALGADRAALRAALAETDVGPGTRIDLGLAEAGALLAAGGRPGAQRAVLLLTDGLQTLAEAPPERVIAAAEALRQGGATIYAIGLGAAIDRDLLAAVASGPDRYYASPSAAELEAIYRAIQLRLACGDGAR